MRLNRYLNEAIKSKMIKGLYGKVRVIEGYKNHKRLYVHKKGKHGYMVTDTEKVSLDNMIKIGSEFWFGTLKELHAALNEGTNEAKGIKVWLDDVRPAPKGWVHIYTVPELIKFYEKNEKNIVQMSLDHDLGENTPEGYKFLTWLEKKVLRDRVYTSIPEISIHSANPVGKKRMEQTIQSIKRHL